MMNFIKTRGEIVTDGGETDAQANRGAAGDSALDRGGNNNGDSALDGRGDISALDSGGENDSALKRQGEGDDSDLEVPSEVGDGGQEGDFAPDLGGDNYNDIMEEEVDDPDITDTASPQTVTISESDEEGETGRVE